MDFESFKFMYYELFVLIQIFKLNNLTNIIKNMLPQMFFNNA